MYMPILHLPRVELRHIKLRDKLHRVTGPLNSLRNYPFAVSSQNAFEYKTVKNY